MDNISLSEKWAMDAFKDGLRAVIRSGGKYYCRPSVNGGKYLMGVKTDAFWHALRAYQDADRKKGVPIFFGNDLNPYEWFRRNYGGFNFTSGDGTRVMPPMIFSKAAKFTNFRWRAGYPKGVQHE